MTEREYNDCVTAHADNVYRFIYKNLKHEEDARDVVQTAYEKMWKNREEVDPAKSKSYLFTVAYHQMIDAGSLLSLGFNVGWANKRINTTNLTFPSQWNGKFFDAHMVGTAPKLDYSNINYLDMQVGMNYAYFPNERTYLNVGVSAMHVNKPKESFFNEQEGVNNTVPARFTAFLNGSFMVSDMLIVNPNVYASLQARSYEIVGGLNAHYNMSGDGEKVLIGGIYYRHKDAIIPMVGLGFKDITLTFTYDVTTSEMKNFNNSRGGFEFSLIKQGVVDRYNGKRRESMCPSFRAY